MSETVFYDYKTPLTETMDDVKKLGAVIVTKDNEYYGVVDDRSIFRTRGLKSLNLYKNFSIGKFATKVPVLDSNTSLSGLINYFHESSAKALPYKEGVKITGIVKREMLLKTMLSLHLLSKVRAGDAMSSPVVVIDPKANVAQATNIMEKHKISRLAVIDKGKLVGIISQRDISDYFAKPMERLPEMKESSSSSAIEVSSIMSSPVYTIDYGKPVEDAIKQILERKMSSLIVTRGSRTVGVISVRDLIENAVAAVSKEQSKIIISGLDDYTKEYEDSIRTSMNNLVDKIDRFEKLSVGYVAVNIRRSRERNYEIKARLALEKRGTVFAHANGYSLDSTLSNLLDSIYKRIREKKETIVDDRKGAERYYGE